ncbi:UDP-glucose dehydrogenase family protein [Nitratireductor basaltis]|uniref:UDP-glucose 6-dehydrogenase n=1 Tax=Nitratireductor basaltis TaxID=472175 RepID=A0A084U8G9_9HYPH|nr:UDP-glucose/GDP-mannose dehydrogenase family protein [Nitratireductor basaltis]KFB09255.1 MtpE [Nitratireductor basaltis]
MNIVIVGCGYVGLVSGACLAQIGHHVLCVDVDRKRIETLQTGACPIYEPGLAELIESGMTGGRLAFAHQLPALTSAIDLVLIAVGTPPAANGEEADLSGVFAVAQEVAEKARGPVVIVTKSTVPPGTGDAIEALMKRQRPDLSFHVASNPEFLREGSAIPDFLQPDRIVIGTESAHAKAKLHKLYKPLTDQGAPLVSTSRIAAEIIKYAANAFLAIKITFINEIANLCEATGADVREVAQGIGKDKRIGGDFLRTGPGYGGSCFPKDTRALAATARAYGVDLSLVEQTIAGNERRKNQVAAKVAHVLGGDLRGRRIAVLGLAFKPETSDTRDSPATALISALVARGAFVTACDPEAKLEPAMASAITLEPDPYDCAQDADCVVLATEWNCFLDLDFARLAGRMRNAVMVDLRNALDHPKLARCGFTTHGLGVPAHAPKKVYTRQARRPITPIPLVSVSLLNNGKRHQLAQLQ